MYIRAVGESRHVKGDVIRIVGRDFTFHIAPCRIQVPVT
jgi:hypothetical protein